MTGQLVLSHRFLIAAFIVQCTRQCIVNNGGNCNGSVWLFWIGVTEIPYGSSHSHGTLEGTVGERISH